MPKNWTLLTGATGFVGREVLKELIAADQNVVVLIRGSRKYMAYERFNRLLDACGLNGNKRIIRINGDITVNPCIEERAGTDICGWVENYVQRVIHCAGDVSFNPNHDPRKVNVLGTTNLLRTMDEMGITELHHVSTAYVCGDRKGQLVSEAIYPEPKSRNEYERSKNDAEALVTEWMIEGNTTSSSMIGSWTKQATIYRPTIVVGNSQTGVSTCFNGFYNLVRLAEMLSRGAGKFSIRSIDKMCIPLTGHEPVNLVPVDMVAKTIVHVALHPELHRKIYHVTPSLPPTTQLVANVLGRYFGFGDKLYFDPDKSTEDVRIANRTIPELLGPYGPYFGTDPTFDSKSMDSVALSFSYRWDEVLTRLIDYAVKRGFTNDSI